MPQDTPDAKNENHEAFMSERGMLVDAARESSRTFDQAVLAFGAAVFGAFGCVHQGCCSFTPGVQSQVAGNFLGEFYHRLACDRPLLSF